jgi:hypothetical protein
MANVATHQARGRASELADPSGIRALEILRTKAGMSMEQGLAFETEALDKKLGSRDLEKIADALVDEKEMKKPHTRADLAYNKFYREHDAQKRLQMLQSDAQTRRVVLGDKEADRFGLMDQKSIAEREAQLKASHEGTGSITRDIEENDKFNPLAAARHKAKIEEGRALADRANKTNEDTFETGQEQERAAHYKSAPDESGVGRAMFGLTQTLDRGLHYAFGGGESIRAMQLRINREREGSEHKEGHKRPATRPSPSNDDTADTDAIASSLGDSPLASPAQSQEIVNHLGQQTALLSQIASQVHSAITVNVHPPAAGRGPRINAIERAAPSASTVLGAE